jgi:hypothetical protein
MKSRKEKQGKMLGKKPEEKEKKQLLLEVEHSSSSHQEKMGWRIDTADLLVSEDPGAVKEKDPPLCK